MQRYEICLKFPENVQEKIQLSEFRKEEAALIKEQAKIPIIPGNAEANDAHAKNENKLEGEDEKLKQIRTEKYELEKEQKQQQQQIDLLRARV